jgi:hypothetical protein
MSNPASALSINVKPRRARVARQDVIDEQRILELEEQLARLEQSQFTNIVWGIAGHFSINSSKSGFIFFTLFKNRLIYCKYFFKTSIGIK